MGAPRKRGTLFYIIFYISFEAGSLKHSIYALILSDGLFVTTRYPIIADYLHINITNKNNNKTISANIIIPGG